MGKLKLVRDSLSTFIKGTFGQRPSYEKGSGNSLFFYLQGVFYTLIYFIARPYSPLKYENIQRSMKDMPERHAFFQRLVNEYMKENDLVNGLFSPTDAEPLFMGFAEYIIENDVSYGFNNIELVNDAVTKSESINTTEVVKRTMLELYIVVPNYSEIMELYKDDMRRYKLDPDSTIDRIYYAFFEYFSRNEVGAAFMDGHAKRAKITDFYRDYTTTKSFNVHRYVLEKLITVGGVMRTYEDAKMDLNLKRLLDDGIVMVNLAQKLITFRHNGTFSVNVDFDALLKTVRFDGVEKRFREFRTLRFTYDEKLKYRLDVRGYSRMEIIALKFIYYFGKAPNVRFNENSYSLSHLYRIRDEIDIDKHDIAGLIINVFGYIANEYINGKTEEAVHSIFVEGNRIVGDCEKGKAYINLREDSTFGFSIERLEECMNFTQ